LAQQFSPQASADLALSSFMHDIPFLLVDSAIPFLVSWAAELLWQHGIALSLLGVDFAIRWQQEQSMFAGALAASEAALLGWLWLLACAAQNSEENRSRQTSVSFMKASLQRSVSN
jgi:hypothetical protein